MDFARDREGTEQLQKRIDMFGIGFAWAVGYGHG